MLKGVVRPCANWFVSPRHVMLTGITRSDEMKLLTLGRVWFRGKPKRFTGELNRRLNGNNILCAVVFIALSAAAVWPPLKLRNYQTLIYKAVNHGARS